MTIALTDNKIMHVGEDGLLDREQAYRLDPSHKPKAINLMYPNFVTILGIYTLEGDTLKIGYGSDYGQRPSDFSAKPEMTTVLRRVSRAFAPVAQRFANAPGCFWMIEPHNPSVFASFAGMGINYFYEKAHDGEVLITMAFLTPKPHAREYRPVLFDAERKRYLPTRSGGGYSAGKHGEGTVCLQRWRMDPTVLSADHVQRIGIEAVTFREGQ